MALNGRLDDMNILEILQIVAFSKKTGTLDVRSRVTNGSVVFRNGKILSAFCSADAHLIGSLPDELLEEKIRTALRQLLALRAGRFEFRLWKELPPRWAGVDVATLLDREGLEPQKVLLELAREVDEARKDTTRLLEESSDALRLSDEVTSDREGAESSVALSEAGATVLVADDEPLVLRVVGDELRRSGCAVLSAATVSEATEHLDRLSTSDDPLLIVADFSMPTSARDSFEGGFEIVRHAIRRGSEAPVLLMAESLSPAARSRARELGIRKVAFKPALAKLDPHEYKSDLRSFAKLLTKELEDLLDISRERDLSPGADPDLKLDVIFDFLRSMRGPLASPASGIARTILRVASQYVERAILFLVRDSRARGLAGAHRGQSAARATELARGLSFELQQARAFAEVVYSREPVRLTEPRELGTDAIDPGKAQELALFPLLLNHEVLAVLYCDNPDSGAPIAKLTGLEIFLVQAGMALENASLHRRLESLEQRHSLDNQGPLTQRVTRTAENGT